MLPTQTLQIRQFPQGELLPMLISPLGNHLYMGDIPQLLLFLTKVCSVQGSVLKSDQILVREEKVHGIVGGGWNTAHCTSLMCGAWYSWWRVAHCTTHAEVHGFVGGGWHTAHCTSLMCGAWYSWWKVAHCTSIMRGAWYNW